MWRRGELELSYPGAKAGYPDCWLLAAGVQRSNHGARPRSREPEAELTSRFTRSPLRTQSQRRAANGNCLRRFKNRLPAFAILRSLNEGVGFGRVCRADILVVPLELLAGAVRDVAEMVRFRRPAGVLEIRTRHWADAHRVVHPLDPMPG